MIDTHARPFRRAAAGFTLAELLLASVLGAMMLTALAVSTFGFAHTLDHMEDEAGVGNDADPVLRRMTKEVREAFWVQHPEPDVLEIADANGDVTTYWVAQDGLWVRRPNGDEGKIYADFDDFTIDSSSMTRKREGDPVSLDGVFYAASASGTAGTLVANGSSNQAIALGFTAPAVPADVPGQAAADEQVVSVSMSAVELPIAFVDEDGNETVTLELYEGWAPGLARPYGSLLATMSLDGDDLPDAVSNGSGGWLPPASLTLLSLSEPLEPGVGYSLVVKVAGSNRIVLKSIPVTPSLQHDEVSKKSGGSWSAQSVVVPFSVRGPWTRTSTETHEVVSLVTLTAYPSNRPLQQRSAAVLSQALTLDPWLGVVPGESAP